MSCFICNPTHISAIVRWASTLRVSVYGITRCLDVSGNEQEVASMLYAENVRSYNHRYREDNAYTGEDDITYNPAAPLLSTVGVIKACRCMEYQSCEHPAWEKSDAKKVLEAIKDDAVTLLPGYDEAAWEVRP